jgi:hypothetical protein
MEEIDDLLGSPLVVGCLSVVAIILIVVLIAI